MVDAAMELAVIAAFAAVVLAAGAEQLHARRCRRIALLAFGPYGKPALWARLAPFARIVCIGGLAWGLTTLLLLKPKVHRVGEIPPSEFRHLILLLDVSPSMKLQDAGPTAKQSRAQRAADLLKSFFERVPMQLYRTTIVAVYNGAKPVVIDTTDLEVVRNILYDLPMNYAFKPGPTDIFAGLTEAARIAQPWRPGSTTVVLLSDGDTVPSTGTPQFPASVAHFLVVGVGDAQAGKFIEGHQSRQDVSTLRQIAVRLRGTYHNGNDKHLPTDLLRQISLAGGKSVFERLSRREYALLACGCGATLLALLPLALSLGGTRWRPGVRPESRQDTIFPASDRL